MDASAKSLGIDRLSFAKRILLMEDIWDSIAAESEALEVPQFHQDELNRRLAAHDAEPHSASNWQDVKSRPGK